MNRFTLAAAAALASLSTAALAEPVAYEFDKSHTVVRASWLHEGMATMSLELTNYDGTLVLDLEEPGNSAIDVTFTLADGMWVGANQDAFLNHLSSPDFFEVEANPTVRFVATAFESEDGQTGVMTGDLTMNGQTHPVSLDVVLNGAGQSRDGRTKHGFTATGSLMRSTWDMGFAVPYISDEIEIFISTEVVTAE